MSYSVELYRTLLFCKQLLMLGCLNTIDYFVLYKNLYIIFLVLSIVYLIIITIFVIPYKHKNFSNKTL